MPVAVLTLQALPISRWQIGLIGSLGLEECSVVATAGSGPASEFPRRATNLGDEYDSIVSAKNDEAGFRIRSDPTPRFDQRSPWAITMRWLNAPHGRLIAAGLFSTFLFGAIIKVTGLACSLVHLRRIVARAHPVGGHHVPAMLAYVRRRIPMRHAPRLLESDELSAPVAAGVIGNFVLLPRGWAGRLRPAETFAVLCHESAAASRDVTIAW